MNKKRIKFTGFMEIPSNVLEVSFPFYLAYLAEIGSDARDQLSLTYEEVKTPAGSEHEGKPEPEHRQGCPASGGYGFADRKCICPRY